MNSLSAGKKFHILLFLSILFFSSCTTIVFFNGPAAFEEFLPPDGFTPVWKTVTKGMDLLSFSNSNPPFYLAAVRIDLRVPEREIVVSRGIQKIEDDTELKGNYNSVTIKQFMEAGNLIASINATPFKPYRLTTGSRQTAVGIVLSEGILYSTNNKYDALFITSDKRVIMKHPPFIISDKMNNGVGGFFIILKNGENESKESPRAARSLIGTSKDGRILILATIDGENTRTGSGSTFFEAAEWMKALGSEDAINLDGGGSSILAYRKKLEDKISILNHPNGGVWRFFQRNIPVFLGIR